MVYLAIKELAMRAEDIIMVTSSIMKDMQPNSEVIIYRPNAIRALSRIIDVCDTVSFRVKMSHKICGISLPWRRESSVSSRRR
jgi:hypothetical protein